MMYGGQFKIFFEQFWQKENIVLSRPERARLLNKLLLKFWGLDLCTIA